MKLRGYVDETRNKRTKLFCRITDIKTFIVYALKLFFSGQYCPDKSAGVVSKRLDESIELVLAQRFLSTYPTRCCKEI